MKKIVSLLLSLLLLSSLSAALAANQVIKVGVVGENNEQWEQVIIPALAKEGVDLQLVKFGDYIMPNQALADGEIDLNAFQHYNFMNKWSSEHGVKLVAIAETLIAPLCIYSEKLTSLDELKEGDTIAIMNDVVNEARALRMLASTGLITLKEGLSELATVADIAENPRNLQFFEMEAAMTANALHDPQIAFGFLNGTHAKDAGYTNDRALLIEAFDFADPTMHGIINVIAAREDKADNPLFQRIVALYHSDEVLELFNTVYKGVYLPAWK